MKTNRLILAVLGFSTLAALPSMAGVGIQINVPAPVVTIPAPAVTVQTPAVTVGVPDSYVWDGTEYVGMVGGAYLYLGPGDVWLPMDGPRLARFHDWAHGHADWQSHAIHNDRYRAHADAHATPMHDDHNARDVHPDDHSHDSDRDHR
jgi:hypothetical protein